MNILRKALMDDYIFGGFKFCGGGKLIADVLIIFMFGLILIMAISLIFFFLGNVLHRFLIFDQWLPWLSRFDFVVDHSLSILFVAHCLI